MRAKHVWGIVLAALILVLLPGLSVLAQDPVGVQGVRTIEPWMPVYVPDEVVVRYRPEAAQAAQVSLGRGLQAVWKETGYKGAFRVFKVPAGTVEQAVRRFQQMPGVLYAEPNYIFYALEFPNDPYFTPYQWNFFDRGTVSAKAISNYGVQAQTAWTSGYNGTRVIVAVVDTGVAYEDYYDKAKRKRYYKAPDLAGTSFVSGWDFVNNDAHPNDDEGHGTHVTGTIAQTTNNGIGVAGIAFGASIMPVKVLNADGSGTSTGVANGIRWAADNGAKVINLSLGSSFGNTTLQSAVQYANARGVTIVAAAGNNGVGSVSYPAAYSECIAVGATRFDGQRASYSNYGSALDLVAPGGDTSYDQNGDGYGDGILQQTFAKPKYGQFGYWFYAGTSMAAPHVSAVAALVVQKHPEYGPDGVRSALQNTAQDLGAPGWDQYYGYGLVNAAGAVSQ